MATQIATALQQRSTEELVREAQLGDREAFGILFRRFERHVLALGLRKLGDFDEAQELCQDVFVQALQKIGQVRDPACFAGWLRSITRRMAINRAVRRFPAVTAQAETLEAARVEERTPLKAVLQFERESELRAGLARLRRMDRETLEAFYVKGQSLVEMSDEFEAPLGTIKRRLHVARKRLAKQVDPITAT